MIPSARGAREEDCLIPMEAAGLRFRNNFVVGSGPAVKSIDQIREIERCGWGGASLKLAIDPPYISLPPRYRWFPAKGYHAFTAETRLDLDSSLRLMERARRETRDLVLFANMAYAGTEGQEGWIRMARKFEAAGAHVIELNMCCPNMSFNVQSSGGRTVTLSGASLGADAEIVSQTAAAVRSAVRIPVFVKLTPEGGKVADVAKACFDKGIPCAGTTGNRLAVPDFDVRAPEKGVWRLQEQPTLACFSGPWLKPLALRDVCEIRRKCRPGDLVMGSGGVENWTDAVQMIMCGADFVQICTAAMVRGFGMLPGIVKGVREFMREKGYSSYLDFRGVVASRIAPANELVLYRGNAKVDQERCTGCGLCARIGHCHAVRMEGKKARVDPAECTGCSTCVDVCPSGAVSMEAFERIAPVEKR